MQTSIAQTPRVRFYWKTGCSSCLRTKEFLAKQGVDFDSINVLEKPDGYQELATLGVRSVPVITQGDRYTFCQSFSDVLKFLGIDAKLEEPLTPAQLFEKLDLVLTAAARYTRQFPASQRHQEFSERPRTKGELAYHIFRVAEIGIGAAQMKGLAQEQMDDKPLVDWTFEDIAQWGLRVRDEALGWWAAQQDRELMYKVPTYYGEHPLAEVLERTVWHSAQHTRQLILMLEDGGTPADRPLTAEDLKGLPLPEQVWG